MNDKITENKPSKPISEIDADLLLQKQEAIAKETRWQDLLCMHFFLFLIFSLAIAFFILPDQEISESENRTLAQAPKITLQALMNGTLAEDVSDYYQDQFPLRDLFRSVNAATDLAMLKLETNNVYFANEGYLIKNNAMDFSYAEKEDAIKTNIGCIRAYEKMNASADIPIRLAVAGRTVDVLRGKLPSFYPDTPSRCFNAYAQYTAEMTTVVDLLTPLKTHAEAGEAVYYKTDHHWTTLGAYYAYAEIIKSYGLEPLPIEAFQIEHASNNFHGTTYSAAGAMWVSPDTLDFYRYEGDENYTTEIYDGTAIRTMNGFYDRSYLSVRDQYSSFIGGNNPLVKIRKNTEEPRPTMILIKDSFGHALAPFLAYHYDLILVDLRYYLPGSDAYMPPISTLASENDASAILFLYNMDTFSSDNNLVKILAR